jgi:predicted dehydrogenase
MLERPDGPDLLETAREVLLRDLLPHLPEPERYQARMVANAMAIARREAEAAPPPARDWAALARAIRAGDLDPGAPGRAEALAALRALARARSAVSNPRVLD